MNFKRFHESKNLFDATSVEKGRINSSTGAIEYAEDTPTLTYSDTDNEFTITTRYAWRGFVTEYLDLQEKPVFSYISDDGTFYAFFYAYDANKNFLGTVTSSVPTGTKYIRVSVQCGTAVTNAKIKNIMLNIGSQPLPYEPYSSEVWHDTPHYIHNTSTDTITALPAVLYPTGTTATVGLKGNTLQSSTPSPTSPVMPQGTGDLETSGAKAGQYKIPISSAGQTTNIYLGEVETTRKIRKLVLTGNEAFAKNDGQSTSYLYYAQSASILPRSIVKTPVICNELPVKNDPPQTVIGINTNNTLGVVYFNFGANVMNTQPSGNTVTGLKEYLAAQYAAGTPVTVWYVLAEPETAIVNEPLHKIGNYADTVSNVSIPVIAGGDTLSVGTTVQPSEVTATYKGWHPVQSVHEAESGQWD